MLTSVGTAIEGRTSIVPLFELETSDVALGEEGVEAAIEMIESDPFTLDEWGFRLHLTP